MDKREEVDRLNRRIDEIVAGRTPREMDAETRLLLGLAGLDLSGESRWMKSERRRLLAMLKERKKPRFFGRLSQAMIRRPYLAGACSLILLGGLTGVLVWRSMMRNDKTMAKEPGNIKLYSINPVGDKSRIVSKGQEVLPKKEMSAPEVFSLGYSDESMLPPPELRNRLSAPDSYPSSSFNTEEYDRIAESRFLKAVDEPLSTFSIDVDTASYANVRRFVTAGQLPPPDAVRIEELINYFTYDYPEPADEKPFSVTTEMAACPWNPGHNLVLIGLQGRRIDLTAAPPNNLVFLLDVSGSMAEPNKLPLLKSSFKLLAQELRPQDRIAVVVYAGAAGLVLPSTSGGEKETILAALDELQAGGSTAGGAGIKLAYETARKSFIRNGNNRVILATDGDFNVGASSDAELERMIEKEREDGIFLSVLGFGMGNYKDAKMEKLADRGNGNYAYIDGLSEAKKVLVDQLGGTLLAIAKDVKIQVEFNPAKVASYRLIGYENRALAAEDFEDDKKDAGELGAGCAVTALYEVIPAGGTPAKGRDLKYQQTAVKGESEEYLTVKLRYKDPDGAASKLISVPLAGEPERIEDTSENFRFAAAVACFGMILRNSEYKGRADYDLVLSLARGAQGRDIGEYRRGFLDLVEECRRVGQRQD